MPHGPHLRKTKLDGAVFAYPARRLGQDAWGQWLLLPRGGRWSAPHDAGLLTDDVIVLLPPAPWVAWWVPRPSGDRLQVDIAHPARCDDDGWVFTDLELDVFQHRATGAVTLVDEDDLAAPLRAGLLPTAQAQAARTAAGSLVADLATAPGWAAAGWRRLDAVRSGGSR